MSDYASPGGNVLDDSGDNSRGGADKKKRSIVAVAAVVVVAGVLAIAGFLGLNTKAGESVTEALGMNTFKSVELPDKSTDLTQVPDAPQNKPDKPQDSHIGVDMLGQTMAPPIPREEEKNMPRQRVQELQTQERERTERIQQVSNIGKRVKVDSIGLDVPLGTMLMADDLVRPTNFTSVFLVKNLGGDTIDKANKERVYLATHTLDEGGIAPGNFFLNKDNTFRVREGDVIDVAGKKFKITHMERKGKSLVSSDKELWDKSKPGIVLLLCITDSNDNGVIEAVPEGW